MPPRPGRAPDLGLGAPCGLLRLDPDHTIRAFNPYLLELTGCSPNRIVGRKFHELLSVAGRIFAQTRLWPELALMHRVEEIALDLRGADGERVPVLINAVQAIEDGRPGDIHVSIMRAVAKRAYEAEVPKARLAAEEGMRAKADFLANVSHEIRTPLNGIIGVAAALERTELQAAQREMVELIRGSGSILERLVTDILKISKLEAGALQLVEQPFDLRRELTGVIEVARIRADEKGLDFSLTFAPDAEGWFSGDAMRLKQIVTNLTSNAVKSTASGRVEVIVGIDRSGGDDRLALTVADTGVVFDEIAGARLFQRFQQADASITRRFGGTGLGLSICKALTDLMGGEIAAQSRPCEGSRFQVSVPLVRCAPPTAESAAAIPANDGRLRILLVEDHPANRRVVEIILAGYEIDLVSAENGAEGVQVWSEAGFDVVLMDMQMPVMDGLSATRAIRALEAQAPDRARTAIAMLSANAMDHHKAEARAAGADTHIAKPVTPDVLLAGIHEAMAAANPQTQNTAFCR